MPSNKNLKDDAEILFVDDETSILEQAKIFLEKENENFEVTTAKDVEKAVELFNKRNFDCVISDYKMPESDGLEFLEILRDEKNSDIPFIILTGKGKEEVAMNAINTGANGYLQKSDSAKGQYRKLSHLIKREIEFQKTGEALRKSEEKYRLIFEKNPIGLLECDSEGKILDINERMIEILGAPDKDTALGRNIMRFGDEEETGIREDMEDAIEKEKVIDRERNITSPWGKEIQMSFRVLPLTGRDGEVTEVTLVCHDVIFY